MKDLRTEAIVLRRVNFGEADRILTILTPKGKFSVLARGARREKSRLASGIEMFCFLEAVLHFGHSEMAILTSAKPKKFYKNILADFNKLEAAGEILKRVAKVSENIDAEEYFELTRQCLEALDRCEAQQIEIILAWFYFNYAKISGEEVNVLFDDKGKNLIEGEKYVWDSTEKSLKASERGKISTNEIKMMRLMLNAKLKLILRVKEAEEMAGELLYVGKTLNQI